MNYVYLKPELENLSQGERISFVRQMRRMTQDEVSEKLGLTGECKRRSMTRYERGDRYDLYTFMDGRNISKNEY